MSDDDRSKLVQDQAIRDLTPLYKDTSALLDTLFQKHRNVDPSAVLLVVRSVVSECQAQIVQTYHLLDKKRRQSKPPTAKKGRAK